MLSGQLDRIGQELPPDAFKFVSPAWADDATDDTVYRLIEQARDGNAPLEAIPLLVAVWLFTGSRTALGASFMESLSLPTLVRALEIIREYVPDAFLASMKQLENATAFASPALRRRCMRALSRLYPTEYWPKRLFIHAATKDKWRFHCAALLLSRHEAFVADIALLIVSAARPELVPPTLCARVAEIVKRQPVSGRLNSQTAIGLATLLHIGGEHELALAVLRLGFAETADRMGRFGVIAKMAELVTDGPLGSLARLRCLVTALRIAPDHDRAGEIVGEIADLYANLPNASISEDVATFGEGGCDALITDAQIDVSPGAQAWLQLPEFLQEHELALPAQIDLPATADLQEVIPLSFVDLPVLPIPNSVDAYDDPWEVATTLRHTTITRRRVRKFILRNVYFQNFSNASFYMDARGQTFLPLSAGHSSFFSLAYVKQVGATPLEGNFFDLTVPYGHSNYSHFLLDRLPRLLWAQQDENMPTLLVDDECLDWMREALSLFGLSNSIQPVRRDRVWLLDRVTAMSKAQHPAQLGEGRYLNFLRRLSAAGDLSKKRRLFIHRDRGTRGIHNEDEFYDGLRQAGFEIVRLESLTLSAQIKLFAEASCVAGVHGAGFSNIVFCRPETMIIEILPLMYSTPAYAIVASQAGLRYMPYIEPGERNLSLARNNQFSDTDIRMIRWMPFFEKCISRLV